MKILKSIITCSLLMLSTSVFALDVNNNAGAQSGSVSGAFAESRSNGVTANSTGAAVGAGATYVQAPAADISRGVGTAFAPALTTTLTETCMGSTSVGAGWSGAALSFGTTWRDHACVRRLDAREIHSYGDAQAAKEIMCDSDLVREAFKRVGRPCAEDGGTYVAVSQTPTPVAAPTPAPEPVATDAEVKDDQDSKALSNAQILQKADEAREAIRTKYAF